jgi:hypothetical protein
VLTEKHEVEVLVAGFALVWLLVSSSWVAEFSQLFNCQQIIMCIALFNSLLSCPVGAVERGVCMGLRSKASAAPRFGSRCLWSVSLHSSAADYLCPPDLYRDRVTDEDLVGEHAQVITHGLVDRAC